MLTIVGRGQNCNNDAIDRTMDEIKRREKLLQQVARDQVETDRVLPDKSRACRLTRRSVASVARGLGHVQQPEDVASCSQVRRTLTTDQMLLRVDF